MSFSRLEVEFGFSVARRVWLSKRFEAWVTA